MTSEAPKPYFFGILSVSGQHSQKVLERFIQDSGRTQQAFFEVISVFKDREGVNRDFDETLKRFLEIDREYRVLYIIVPAGSMLPRLARAVLLQPKDRSGEVGVGIELDAELDVALRLESDSEVMHAVKDIKSAIVNFDLIWQDARRRKKRVLTERQVAKRGIGQFEVLVVRS